MKDLKKKIDQGVRWLYKTRQKKNAQVDHFGVWTTWDMWELSFIPVGADGAPVVCFTPTKQKYDGGQSVSQVKRGFIKKMRAALEEKAPVSNHWLHSQGGVSFGLKKLAREDLRKATGRGRGPHGVIPRGFE